MTVNEAFKIKGGDRCKCPDCGGEIVITKKKGWECLNPDCDVIRVTTKRGLSWEVTKVVRRATVIEGGKTNG